MRLLHTLLHSLQSIVHVRNVRFDSSWTTCIFIHKSSLSLSLQFVMTAEILPIRRKTLFNQSTNPIANKTYAKRVSGMESKGVTT